MAPVPVKEWFSRYGKRILLLIAIAALLSLPFTSSQRIRWLGFRDVHLEFLVLDGDTEQLIHGASLYVYEEGGKGTKEFRTGPGGSVRFIRECTSYGEAPVRKGVRLHEHPMGVELPPWYVWASARNYQASEPAWLDVYYKQLVHGEKASFLSVRIKLRKQPTTAVPKQRH